MDQLIDWAQAAHGAAKIALAYMLALPIGLDREHEDRNVGLRTFPLVAMAGCGYVMLGDLMGSHTPDAQSRIVQGLITGIGFVGAGAILKGQSGVHGTATAASIWATGAIGASVAMGRYDVAVVLTLLNLFTLRVLRPFKERIDRGKDEENGSQEPE